MIGRPPNELTALEAVQAIEAGALSSETLVRACLERILARNPEVLAFTAVSPEVALDHARKADQARLGPLCGVPFAVKDTIETADYETTYGSEIYAGYRPRADAACVAAARERGAVVLGKVATCEFGTLTPCATRNPLSLDRTPGGSSSGSAAAVADCMVPVAFGSQTTSSTVRPAAYCGVVGYKPTFGFINRTGLKALAPSLDTVSVFTRDVADAAYFVFGLFGAKQMLDTASRPRIGICLSGHWAHARKEATDAIERMAAKAERSGAQVRRVELPVELEKMVALQTRLTGFEGRHSLAHERLHHYGKLSPRLQARLESERDLDPDEYLHILQRMIQAREVACALFDDVDALLYPAAQGEADLGQSETGSPLFGSLWSLLHLPVVSVPVAVGPAGMPLGVQLIGANGNDARLLNIAGFVSRHSEFRGGTP